MERLLRPDRFDADPNSTEASDVWEHWFYTFNNFLETIESYNPDKLKTLIHFLSPTVYKFICRCSSYEAAIATLQDLYVQPTNEIYARHLLATCKQEYSESLDQFMQKLRALARDCNFQAVSAETNQNDAIRDAFISGITSNSIRQRLLEHKTLDINAAFDQAKSLDLAQKQSQSFHSSAQSAVCHASSKNEDGGSPSTNVSPMAASGSTCFFCGNFRHPRYQCPARDAVCKSCGKKGHFQKVCRTSAKSKYIVSATSSVMTSTVAAAVPACLSKAVTNVIINGITLQALIDTGSSESYVCETIILQNDWQRMNSRNQIVLASTQLTSTTKGHCIVSLIHKGILYPRVKLAILPNLCADVLLGHDFLRLHESVQIPFEGHLPPFSLCNLLAAKIPAPSLFDHLDPSCRPIATKSRRHTPQDEMFIRKEIDNLLKDGIIEASKSPWRAQVLVTTNERHKKRLVVDYSQTINRFTHLDAYPLPRIDKMVEQIADYSIFSTLDLKNAYHQVPIKESEKHFTAFEACNNLYQFCRIPFGVTNGVACFQRTMDELIRKENLCGTHVYVDNVTVCGHNQDEHDKNLHKFMELVDKYGLTLNHKKCCFSMEVVRLLGYEVSKNTIKPDPDRFTSLLELPPPCDMKAQQRMVGMFAYYAHWISRFSDKIHPLVHNKIFPPPVDVKNAFEALKQELLQAAVVTINKDIPLVVETDASDVAVSASLNQNGRPVAFFSRTLSSSEKNHSAVEKEAYAIVEAIRKWRHYLLGTHFKLVTDQRSVSFMYDQKKSGKVKNDKIQRWRIELSPFSYDVVYRPGPENKVADTLSRAVCSISHSTHDLKTIHDTLCHPGVTRFYHFVRAKNLPFSLDDVKAVIQRCSVCAELKPRFYKTNNSSLIKATQPFERISVDFKGPVPSVTQNKFILTVIDEYSRFPFAFACPNISSSTVISRFIELFSVFGMPSFVHSDRGSSFMSTEVKDFLHSRGVATSRTTAYNPQANGQVERLNGTLWKAIQLCLRSKGMRTEQWESVLPDALHSIRSLLCTSTNATPHERMFMHNRKSPVGTTLPQWLVKPGPILLKRNIRASKYDPLVEEAELLEGNPEYAHVRLMDGREETVSLRQLAPVESKQEKPNVENDQPSSLSPSDTSSSSNNSHNAISDSDGEENLKHMHQQQQRTRPYCLRSREV